MTLHIIDRDGNILNHTSIVEAKRATPCIEAASTNVVVLTSLSKPAMAIQPGDALGY